METIQEAKEFLKENYQKGCQCPACGQHVKLYKRKLNSGMARVLIEVYKKRDLTSIHVKDHLRKNKLKNNHDWTLLKYWGMIENIETNGEQKDSGYWRITLRGIQFVNLGVAPKHILIYNKKFMGFSNEVTDIRESLGNHFDYNELMGM